MKRIFFRKIRRIPAFFLVFILLFSSMSAVPAYASDLTMREQVEAKLAEVEALNEEDYTEESWNALWNLYTQIKTGLPTSTDEELEEGGSFLISALDYNINALVRVEDGSDDSDEDNTDGDDGYSDLVEVTDEYLTQILNNEITIDGEICYDKDTSSNSFQYGLKFYSAYAKNDENGLEVIYQFDIAALSEDRLFQDYTDPRDLYIAVGESPLTATKIELDEEGKFSLNYTTLEELKDGLKVYMYITLDRSTTSGGLVEDTSIWSCVLTPDFANKPLTLVDEETGVIMLTSTKYYSEDAELIVEEIPQTTDGDPNTDPWANMISKLGDSLKIARMYNISMQDGSKTITSFDDWSASILIPIDSIMDADSIKFFYNIKSGSTFNYGYLDKYCTVTDDNYVFYTKKQISGNYAVYETASLDESSENLEDGTYTVNISIWKMIDDVASMANQGVVSPATLVVKDGVKTIYFDMQAVSNSEMSSYMTHMWVYDEDVTYSEAGYPDGEMYAAIAYVYYKNEDGSFMTDVFNADSLNYYPQSVYFELPSDEAVFPVRFRVPVMDLIGGGDFAQDARFIIDYSSAVKVSDETTEVPISMALTELLKIASEANEEDYTEDSWAAFSVAYDAADILSDNTSATTAQLTESYTLLRDAIDNLVLSDGSEDTEEEDKVEGDASLDKDNLADGKYTLTATMLKLDQESYSMANSAINHTVWLEVIDGEYYLTIQFKGLAIYNQFGYLQNLFYWDDGWAAYSSGKISGEKTQAEVLSYQTDSEGSNIVDQYNDEENPYPELVRIKLVDKASGEYVPLQVFVPIMESIADGTGTQNVLMYLDWTTLNVNEDGEINKEEQVEQSPSIDITDEATGVRAVADAGVFDEGVTLVVKEITSGDDYDSAVSILSDVGTNFKLYEVYFIDKDGNEVQPNGTVSVYYPIPADYNISNLVLYRINDGGGKTKINGSTEEGYYVATQRSFSMYALVDTTENTDTDSGADTSTDAGSTTSPQTGDDSSVAVWITTMFASAGALGFLFFKKRYHRQCLGE